MWKTAAASLLVLSCGAPPEPAPPPRPVRTSPARATGEQCSAAGQPAAERVELTRGRTTRLSSGIAITFVNVSHDSYDDGRTDTLLHLGFRGVDESGELTPSELTWMPSALARPEWVYLQVDRCVRVVEAGGDRVVLEVFRPSR